MSELWKLRLDQLDAVASLILLLLMIGSYTRWFVTGDGFEMSVILSLIYIAKRE